MLPSSYLFFVRLSSHKLVEQFLELQLYINCYWFPFIIYLYLFLETRTVRYYCNSKFYLVISEEIIYRLQLCITET